MRIQLLYFPDCPNHEAARELLRRSMASLELGTDFEDIDVTAPGTPEEYRAWGSPTILVNGVDAGGLTGGRAGASCRLYGKTGIPTAEQITALLIAQMSSGSG